MSDYSNTPDIIKISSHNRVDVLKPTQIESLKNGTLRILSEIGIYFPSEKALKIFSDHGADVDWETKIVKIQPDLVKKAMSTAPRSFVLGGREERFDLTLDGKNSHMATDGCGVHVIDIKTREMRPSRKEDVATMARITDALPILNFFWPMVSAQDYGQAAPLHECHAGLTNTLKHVRGGTTVHPALATSIVEMATAVSGSVEERRKRPPVNANICTIAPLAQDTHGIESALIYAEAGLPVSFMAMPTMGSTAPASILGALMEGDAEVVSAMVLIQLAYPGAPVVHSIITSLMNPRTGGYISDAPIPVSYIAVQLAHSWGVPSLGGGSFSSDAKNIGWQSAFEGGFGGAQIPFAGGDVCGYLGMMNSSMILYPEQIMFDAEIAMNVYEMHKAFDFKELEINLEVIKDVGPRGHFLRQKHTRDHMRDFHYSPIFHQMDADGKSRDPQEMALEEFNNIYENHKPEPLPENVLKELDQILALADKIKTSLER